LIGPRRFSRGGLRSVHSLDREYFSDRGQGAFT
jgi:hypothetical protein